MEIFVLICPMNKLWVHCIQPKLNEIDFYARILWTLRGFFVLFVALHPIHGPILIIIPVKACNQLSLSCF